MEDYEVGEVLKFQNNKANWKHIVHSPASQNQVELFVDRMAAITKSKRLFYLLRFIEKTPSFIHKQVPNSTSNYHKI